MIREIKTEEKLNNSETKSEERQKYQETESRETNVQRQRVRVLRKKRVKRDK